MFLAWCLVPVLIGVAQAALGLLAVEGPLPSFYVLPTCLVLWQGKMVYDRRYLVLKFLRQERRNWWDQQQQQQLPSWPLRRLCGVQPVDHISGQDPLLPLTSIASELHESTTQDSQPPTGLNVVQQLCPRELLSIIDDLSTVSCI